MEGGTSGFMDDTWGQRHHKSSKVVIYFLNLKFGKLSAVMLSSFTREPPGDVFTFAQAAPVSTIYQGVTI
jgi:hypothetical protein